MKKWRGKNGGEKRGEKAPIGRERSTKAYFESGSQNHGDGKVSMDRKSSVVG